MSKDDLNKERLQSLAFSHFAVEQYDSSNPTIHENNFYLLFDQEKKPPKRITNLYLKYLSKDFKFDDIYGVWSTPKKFKDVKIVYDVAKTFYLSNKISRNFSQYEFLDQIDPFMITIKNDPLERIIKALKLNFKVNILSSADIYIIKKTAKRKILSEINNNIIRKNDLYLINNFHNYGDILRKYWKRHELFGVSLKLPSTIRSIKNIKIVGAEDDILNKKMSKIVDPYTKFLSMLADKDTDIRKLINETIEIKNQDITKAAWDFKFRFNYKKLNLYSHDIDFILKS